MAPAGFRRESEVAAVKRHKLVGLIVEAVPRQFNVGMRNYHPLKRRIVKSFLVPTLNNRAAVPPVAVDGKGHAAVRSGSSLPGRISECAARSEERRVGKEWRSRGGAEQSRRKA